MANDGNAIGGQFGDGLEARGPIDRITTDTGRRIAVRR
jgi:hypothetical protein